MKRNEISVGPLEPSFEREKSRKGRLTVTSDGVLVDGDVGEVADLFDLGSGQTKRPEVPEDQVVVGSARLELVVRTVLHDGRGEGLGVLDDGGGVLLELRRGGLLEGDGDTGDGLTRERRKQENQLHRCS
jgi:hypothetical protein